MRRCARVFFVNAISGGDMRAFVEANVSVTLVCFRASARPTRGGGQ